MAINMIAVSGTEFRESYGEIMSVLSWHGLSVRREYLVNVKDAKEKLRIRMGSGGWRSLARCCS
jgi:hypothetical protein